MYYIVFPTQWSCTFFVLFHRTPRHFCLRVTPSARILLQCTRGQSFESSNVCILCIPTYYTLFRDSYMQTLCAIRKTNNSTIITYNIIVCRNILWNRLRTVFSQRRAISKGTLRVIYYGIANRRVDIFLKSSSCAMNF